MRDNRERLICMAIGLAGGILGSLLGLGGGIFIIPGLMTFLARIGQHRIHGTTLSVVMLVALTSSLVYGAHGNLDLRLAVVLAAGSLVGVVMGARLMARIPAKQLRRLFGLFLLVVGLRMLLG